MNAAELFNGILRDFVAGQVAAAPRAKDECEQCDAPPAEDGLCRDCWDEINGQFGVGA